MLVSVVFLTKLSKYFRLTRIQKFKILINIDVVKGANRRRIDMESNEKKNIDSYKSHEKIMQSGFLRGFV